MIKVFHRNKMFNEKSSWWKGRSVEPDKNKIMIPHLAWAIQWKSQLLPEESLAKKVATESASFKILALVLDFSYAQNKKIIKYKNRNGLFVPQNDKWKLQNTYKTQTEKLFSVEILPTSKKVKMYGLVDAIWSIGSPAFIDVTYHREEYGICRTRRWTSGKTSGEKDRELWEFVLPFQNKYGVDAGSTYFVQWIF